MDPDVDTTGQPYTYASDDPVNGSDSSGLAPIATSGPIPFPSPVSGVYVLVSAVLTVSGPALPLIGGWWISLSSDSGGTATVGKGGVTVSIPFKGAVTEAVALWGLQYSYSLGESRSFTLAKTYTKTFTDEPLFNGTDSLSLTVLVTVTRDGSPPTALPEWALELLTSPAFVASSEGLAAIAAVDAGEAATGGEIAGQIVSGLLTL